MSRPIVSKEDFKKGNALNSTEAWSLALRIYEIVSSEARSGDWKKWCTHGAWPAVIQADVLKDGESLAMDDGQNPVILAGLNCYIGDIFMLEDAKWMFSNRNFKFAIIGRKTQ